MHVLIKTAHVPPVESEGKCGSGKSLIFLREESEKFSFEHSLQHRIIFITNMKDHEIILIWTKKKVDISKCPSSWIIHYGARTSFRGDTKVRINMGLELSAHNREDVLNTEVG